MNRLRMTLASFLILYGAACGIAVTLIALLVLSTLFGGFVGMLIALAVCAMLGAAWAYVDERRLERQYKEDTTCSQ